MSRAVLSNDRITGREYATADDFQKLFACDMVDLFRLAFLLTADAAKAEHCVIVTMHECMANDSVFKDWLPVWTRRALIRNGIGIVTGRPARSTGETSQHQPFSVFHRSQRSALDPSSESAGIFQLSDFDRLVYVICVLERCPTQDCATLLDRSRQEVRNAQDRALSQTTAFENEWRRPSHAGSADLCPTSHEDGTGSDGSCGSLLT